ncbi:MAG: indole-3-glycerol phosphate synthase TrpC [Gemmatimonadota bacterium]
MILRQILESKRVEVEELRGRAAELAERAAAGPPVRDFAAAVRRRGRVSVIAEFKRRSPSAGELAPRADAGRVAAAYEAGGAAAISVLTDAPWFGGSLEDLAAARAATRLPVLRKDFVLDSLQVLEARAQGADAILLIVRLVDDTRLAELLDVVRKQGMAALVEVHEPEELKRALAAGAELIGVNARDLSTFDVDLEASAAILRRVPPERIAVAESAIRGPEDVRRAAAVGADAVLVGGWLMERDPARAVSSLVDVPKIPGVKVCGIRRERDAAAADAAEVDYVGFLFGESPRRVTAARASAIARGLRARAVGVFVDSEPAEIMRVREAVPIEVAQLHGRETVRECGLLRDAGLRVWKAIRPRSPAELLELAGRYAPIVDGLLAEGFSSRAAGGTATPLPLEWWDELRDIAGGVAVILAGGLTPENVAGAVAAARPDLVDVSSGVERSPGEKDARRIRAFVDRVRGGG